MVGLSRGAAARWGTGTCLAMVLSLSRPSDGPAGIRILLVMSGPEAGRGVGLRLLGNTSVNAVPSDGRPCSGCRGFAGRGLSRGAR
jgi:hypothetical protein